MGVIPSKLAVVHQQHRLTRQGNRGRKKYAVVAYWGTRDMGVEEPLCYLSNFWWGTGVVEGQGYQPKC